MAKKKDRVLIGPPVEKGHLFIRDNGVEQTVGILSTDSPLEETSGYMQLNHVKGPLYEVESCITYTSGPAQVATDKYRTGWNNIFGKKQAVGQA